MTFSPCLHGDAMSHMQPSTSPTHMPHSAPSNGGGRWELGSSAQACLPRGSHLEASRKVTLANSSSLLTTHKVHSIWEKSLRKGITWNSSVFQSWKLRGLCRGLLSTSRNVPAEDTETSTQNGAENRRGQPLSRPGAAELTKSFHIQDLLGSS